LKFEVALTGKRQALYAYRLLVHDKVIALMPEDWRARRRYVIASQLGMRTSCPKATC
jgi:hypothetical protein